MNIQQTFHKNEFKDTEEYLKHKDEFIFLVDLSVAAWKLLSYTILSIGRVKLSSKNTIDTLFNSKEIRKHKDTFPFIVDMQEMWNDILKTMKNTAKLNTFI